MVLIRRAATSCQILGEGRICQPINLLGKEESCQFGILRGSLGMLLPVNLAWGWVSQILNLSMHELSASTHHPWDAETRYKSMTGYSWLNSPKLGAGVLGLREYEGGSYIFI
jgi:hypothetical protein